MVDDRLALHWMQLMEHPDNLAADLRARRADNFGLRQFRLQPLFIASNTMSFFSSTLPDANIGKP